MGFKLLGYGLGYTSGETDKFLRPTAEDTLSVSSCDATVA